MTGLIIVVTRHVAGRTDDLHVFMRRHGAADGHGDRADRGACFEISVLGQFMTLAGITIPNVEAFEFAFENYMALGYGDVVASGGCRLIGPIMALNGLLLIGWSVAIIFEVMRMAEVQIATKARFAMMTRHRHDRAGPSAAAGGSRPVSCCAGRGGQDDQAKATREAGRRLLIRSSTAMPPSPPRRLSVSKAASRPVPLYNGQDYLGDDPDPNIRSYLIRDMARYGGPSNG